MSGIDLDSGQDGMQLLNGVRQRAQQFLSRLSATERESIIVKCWMSHDARWFAAAAMTFGLEAAMRLNKLAVREEGKAEVRRLVRLLDLPEVRDASDFLLFQETAISRLGPELLDYAVTMHGRDRFDLCVQRCFAFDQVSRAGIAHEYECGIVPRIQGWLDELRIDCEISPEPARCLKSQGLECMYSFQNMRPVGPRRTP